MNPKKAHQETIIFTYYLNYQKELFLCKVIQNMNFFKVISTYTSNETVLINFIFPIPVNTSVIKD